MRKFPSLIPLLLAACTADLSGPAATDQRPTTILLSAVAGSAQVTAFAQNVYVGTNVDLVLPALLSSDPNDDLPALQLAADVLEETDFTVRAAGIAAEIERTRPHAIGLNEISTIDVDLTPLGVPIQVGEDLLTELLDALAVRGLNYTVAAAVQGLVAAPPLGGGATVSIVDRDVVLVDADRVTLVPGTISRNYSTNVGPIAAGVLLVRGFVVVPAMIEGRLYHIAATHLEADLAGFPPFDMIRWAQMGELLAYLPSGTPTILMGDLNDVPGSPMHQLALGAGFADAWSAFHPQSDGFTCCNSDNLADKFPAHVKRIDYVLARGLDGPNGTLTGRIDRYGATRSDLLQGPEHPLWPSDHVGLVARFVVPAAMFR